MLINYAVFIFTLLFSAPGALLVEREGTLINWYCCLLLCTNLLQQFVGFFFKASQ